MFTDIGFGLIRITIWLAVAAWLGRLFIERSQRNVLAQNDLIRWIWLIGALAAVGHTIAAMGFGHCWSLTNAMRHTGLVTRQVTGYELPYSVFVNFAFVAYWLLDSIREYRTPQVRPLGLLRHTLWAVMMVNGTVVFGPHYWRWIAVLVVVAWLFLFRNDITEKSGEASPQTRT